MQNSVSESPFYNSFTSKAQSKGYRRWNYFKDRLIERFGEIVYKIGVDAGFDCPNRDGSKAFGGCAYCSQEGSLSPHQDPKLLISEQIARGQRFTLRRYGAHKHIIYYQSFTNTYAPVNVLRERYDQALNREGVVGMSIASRPDCINSENADLLAEYAEKFPLFAVELGLQSAHQNRLEWVNRQEGTEDYLKAMKLLRDRHLKVITHVILGFPGESREDMQDTVQLADSEGSAGVKLQMLHVIKKTKLEHLYRRDFFRLMNAQEYGELLIYLLERVRPNLEIHRITGETAAENLVAPEWVSDKSKFFAWFEKELELRNTWQGRCYQK